MCLKRTKRRGECTNSSQKRERKGGKEGGRADGANALHLRGPVRGTVRVGETVHSEEAVGPAHPGPHP